MSALAERNCDCGPCLSTFLRQRTGVVPSPVLVPRGSGRPFVAFVLGQDSRGLRHAAGALLLSTLTPRQTTPCGCAPSGDRFSALRVARPSRPVMLFPWRRRSTSCAVLPAWRFASSLAPSMHAQIRVLTARSFRTRNDSVSAPMRLWVCSGDAHVRCSFSWCNEGVLGIFIGLPAYFLPTITQRRSSACGDKPGRPDQTEARPVVFNGISRVQAFFNSLSHCPSHFFHGVLIAYVSVSQMRVRGPQGFRGGHFRGSRSLFPKLSLSPSLSHAHTYTRTYLSDSKFSPCCMTCAFLSPPRNQSSFGVGFFHSTPAAPKSHTHRPAACKCSDGSGSQSCIGIKTSRTLHVWWRPELHGKIVCRYDADQFVMRSSTLPKRASRHTRG